jgi:hypothetical protein
MAPPVGGRDGVGDPDTAGLDQPGRAVSRPGTAVFSLDRVWRACHRRQVRSSPEVEFADVRAGQQARATSGQRLNQDRGAHKRRGGGAVSRDAGSGEDPPVAMAERFGEAATAVSRVDIQTDESRRSQRKVRADHGYQALRREPVLQHHRGVAAHGVCRERASGTGGHAGDRPDDGPAPWLCVRRDGDAGRRRVSGQEPRRARARWPHDAGQRGAAPRGRWWWRTRRGSPP